MSETVCIKVAVRVRPLISLENSRNSCTTVVRKTKNEPQVEVNDDKVIRKFTYDHVFDANYTQKEIYDSCVANVLTNLFQGKKHIEQLV